MKLQNTIPALCLAAGLAMATTVLPGCAAGRCTANHPDNHCRRTGIIDYDSIKPAEPSPYPGDPSSVFSGSPIHQSPKYLGAGVDDIKDGHHRVQGQQQRWSFDLGRSRRGRPDGQGLNRYRWQWHSRRFAATC